MTKKKRSFFFYFFFNFFYLIFFLIFLALRSFHLFNTHHHHHHHHPPPPKIDEFEFPTVIASYYPGNWEFLLIRMGSGKIRKIRFSRGGKGRERWRRYHVVWLLFYCWKFLLLLLIFCCCC